MHFLVIKFQVTIYIIILILLLPENVFAKEIKDKREFYIINIGVEHVHNPKVDITLQEFKRLCRLMNKKIKYPQKLTIEECIICVRIMNSFPRNFIDLPKSKETYYNRLRTKLGSMVLFFSYKLEATVIGTYFYSEKYDIWIGGGIGGASTHPNSKYRIVKNTNKKCTK